MPDLENYQGKYNPDIKATDFSKEILSQLMTEYAKIYVLTDGLWYSIIEKRYGLDVAHEIDTEMWVNLLPKFEVKPVMKILGLNKYNVEDYCKFSQFMPSFPVFFKREIELINENHALFTVRDCPALRRFETKEPHKIKPICQELELACFKEYVKQVNPKMEVTQTIMPPRKSPNDICCQFELKLEE